MQVHANQEVHFLQNATSFVQVHETLVGNNSFTSVAKGIPKGIPKGIAQGIPKIAKSIAQGIPNQMSQAGLQHGRQTQNPDQTTTKLIHCRCHVGVICLCVACRTTHNHAKREKSCKSLVGCINFL
jgi:hypothetical protein